MEEAADANVTSQALGSHWNLLYFDLFIPTA
jgi:hypothetical protein